MKKIAILTFHRGNNFGAVLQSYALQRYLNSTGYAQACIVDYRSKEIEARGRVTALLRHKGSFAKKIAVFLLCFKDTLSMIRKFNQFREKYLVCEAIGCKKEDMSELSGFDLFICGSDQVWNPDITHFDKTFFLDFVEKAEMKYSYAASVGESNHIDCNRVYFEQQLKNFNTISVREKSAAIVLDKILENKNIRIDIDPVFLLDAKHWRGIKKAIHRAPYILFFMMGTSATAYQAMEFAVDLGKEKGLDVVLLSDTEKWFKYREMIHYGVASPEEFLGLIDGAELIVTNSFHATAFSIILNKEFYVETNILRKERILGLLEMVHLEKRGLKRGNRCSTDDSIDWKEVNRLLNSMIDDSRNYLRNIISD